MAVKIHYIRVEGKKKFTCRDCENQILVPSVNNNLICIQCGQEYQLEIEKIEKNEEKNEQENKQA